MKDTSFSLWKVPTNHTPRDGSSAHTSLSKLSPVTTPDCRRGWEGIPVKSRGLFTKVVGKIDLGNRALTVSKTASSSGIHSLIHTLKIKCQELQSLWK